MSDLILLRGVDSWPENVYTDKLRLWLLEESDDELTWPTEKICNIAASLAKTLPTGFSMVPDGDGGIVFTPPKFELWRDKRWHATSRSYEETVERYHVRHHGEIHRVEMVDGKVFKRHTVRTIYPHPIGRGDVQDPKNMSRQSRIIRLARKHIPTGPAFSIHLPVNKNQIAEASAKIAEKFDVPHDSISFSLLIHHATEHYLPIAVKQLSDLHQNTEPKGKTSKTSRRVRLADYAKITQAAKESKISITSLIKAIIALTGSEHQIAEGDNRKRD